MQITQTGRALRPASYVLSGPLCTHMIEGDDSDWGNAETVIPGISPGGGWACLDLTHA